VSSNIGPLKLSYTPLVDGWYTIVINNTLSTVSAMKAWVNVTYTAPMVVNTRIAAREALPPVSSNVETTPVFQLYPNPTIGGVNLSILHSVPAEKMHGAVRNAAGQLLGTFYGTLTHMQSWLSEIISSGKKGVYVVSIWSDKRNYVSKLVKQ